MILPQSPEVKKYLRLVSRLSIKRAFKGMNQKCNEGRNWRHVSCTCTRNIVQGFIRGLTTFATFGLTGATYNYAYRNRFDVISAILLSYRKI